MARAPAERRRRRNAALCGLAGGIVCGVVRAALPGLTVPDLIGLTQIGSAQWGGDTVVSSPDQTRVAFVTQRGDLSTNRREFSLWVIDPKALRARDRRRPIATFASSSNRPAITQVTWLSKTRLAFIGERDDAPPQVYELHLPDGSLIERTHEGAVITVYKTASAGHVLVYATEREQSDVYKYASLRAHGFVVPDSSSLTDIVAGKWGSLLPVADTAAHVLHVVRDGAETTVPLPSADTYGDCDLSEPSGRYNLTLSPAGNAALLRCRPKKPPAAWYAYQLEDMRRALDRGSVYPWWIVIDLNTGRAHPLTGAPQINVSDATRMPQWTEDGSAAVVEDDLLPLTGVDAQERDFRAGTRLTGEINVETGEMTRVHHHSVSGSIKGASSAAARVELRQGLNEPWKLVAVKKARLFDVVFDPNPDLAKEHSLARETLLSWRVKSGAQLTAGVYWPLDYQKGMRYPVVIQTHGFVDGVFAPDGYSTTGYAAQPLAASGMMVVQAYKCTEGCDGTPRKALTEGQQNQEAFEGLIDRLHEQQLIDRTRVGLQGYSRSSFDELYFITHSAYPIAAMTCADGVDFSYLQYLAFALAYPDIGRSYAHANGGAPFGEGLKSWFERAPGFNLDRVHTPIQLTALRDGSSVVEEWEPFAGLVLQGKPVELVYIPDAAHEIVKPWERFTSQQGAVDWFRFWLQGYERTIPVAAVGESSRTLADQYARWHGLRELQQSSMAAHAIQ